jgi:uncharacterized protein with FMN-binding domain
LVDAEGGVVRLRRSTGQVISIPLARLSEVDQEFVRRQAGGAALAPGEASEEQTVDEIEFRAGSKLRGKIVARDDQTVTIETVVGNRTMTRKCALSTLRAITSGGKREVLQSAGQDDSATAGNPSGSASGGASGSAAGNRSKAEVDALINQLGRKPPDWWDSVTLNHPQSLDLSWPEKPNGPWNPQKNVGQYVWDIINPNPGRWREGIRFMHHLLTIHEKNPATQMRVMASLGRMYQDFEQDYARAAFWWRQAGAESGPGSPSGVKLAECYWKLGNKQMAVTLLNRLPVFFPAIKLWADMGETRRALQLAESAARTYPDMAYIHAGDACRVAGMSREAIAYYEKVLTVPATGKTKERVERYHQRARANIDGIRIFDMLDVRRVPDGTYQGVSPSYAGDLRVRVVIQGGRIVSVEVTDHKDKQFYSALTDTPRQIVEKQGIKGVDAVTGATITSEAIINAVARALASGVR